MTSESSNTDDMTLGAGFTLLRASRLAALVEPLRSALQSTKPEHPLTPQTVVVAHPGMKQWLIGALAGSAGPGHVVANLDLQLPSSWLDALSMSLLGDRAVALPQYRRAHLRWTLHAMLGEASVHGVTDPRLSAFLEDAVGEDERARRRFQLADRLARVYSQYLVYRSDWLAAWEAGKHGFVTATRGDERQRALETQCLAPLWQATVSRLGEHRGRLVQALPQALAHASDQLPPLHVFGLSHLPPVELDVLRSYARLAPVILYVPDPCREFWGGLYAAQGEGRWRMQDAGAWRSFREEEQTRLQDPDALDWREQGHPLLARWGRMGQHFFAALADDEVREDTRHWQDQQPATPTTRLARLQDSIRSLDPDLLHEDIQTAEARADTSLRVHACHTRLRELEVLHDVLLDAIDKGGVRPGDIVVMAPDIQHYLPLIASVFGEPGAVRDSLLPFHLADVPVALSHPLFTLFETLLGIGGARVTATDVVDLLGHAELRRALALDSADLDSLLEWLRESRVAWGLDGMHKADLHLPARAEFSFAWAMDRMLAGYVMGAASVDGHVESVSLPDGVALIPVAGIDGPSANAIGALDRLLRELQVWRGLAHQQQSASAWADALRVRFDALVRIDPEDGDARDAHSAIHRAIAQMAAEPARNGQDPELRLSVVRELLQDTLAAVPERQRYLLGGITFCGMVPQRAIPFEVICVLGLDEGGFPRRSADGGIDLIEQFRRIGDRDVATDDRYLFLETAMSAGKRLHLSYLGQNVRDGKPRNPATPLAELLAELDARCGIATDAENPSRPWRVQHPLQPFDGRYFDPADPALFTYSRAFAGMTGEGGSPMPSLRQTGMPTSEPWPDPLPLRSLENFFKDPAKALLKDRLQLSLDALDDDARLPDEEPMDGISPLHALASRLFLSSVLPRKCSDPDWQWQGSPPDWVAYRGLMPLGETGQQAWRIQADAIAALWEKAEASGRFDARSGQGGQTVPVEVCLHDGALHEAIAAPQIRIFGSVRNVFPLRNSERGLQLVVACPKAKQDQQLHTSDELTFKHRVPAFLQWALLRLQHAGSGPPDPVRLTLLAEDEPDLAVQANAWDLRYCVASETERRQMEDDLRLRVRGLVDFARCAGEGRAMYYPQASWAAAQVSRKKKTGRKGRGKSASKSGAADACNDVVAGEQQVKDVSIAEIAKSVGSVWTRDFGDIPGERDYAPGYSRLLEGDLRFGDSESDPGSHALHALFRDAEALDALLQLGVAEETDGTGDAATGDAS